MAIPPHIIPALQHHLEHLSEAGPDGLVFVGPKGGALSSANFGADVWRPAVTSVGLRGFTFHGLRGVSATLAARQGATTKELMRRLGHATPDMAMRYQRADAERDRALARAMSDGLSGRSLVPSTVLPKFNKCTILQSDPDGLSATVSIVVADKQSRSSTRAHLVQERQARLLASKAP